MATFLYIAWQIAWGLPQTLAGALVFAAHASCPRFVHHGALVTVWGRNAGLSLGPFVFVNAHEGPPESAVAVAGGATRIDDRLLVHEYGHTVQSLILGPLYLLAIGLPSVIWLNAPRFVRRRRETGASYYSFYTERWANVLGERVLGRPSMC